MPEVLYGAGGGFNLTAPQSVQTQGIFSGGVSNLGNTAGTTGLVTNRVVLVGGSNVTLSQSSGVNGATVTINGASGGAGADVTLLQYPIAPWGWSTIGLTAYSGSTSAAGASTHSTMSYYVQPYYIDHPVQASKIEMINNFAASAGTGSVTVLDYLGLYAVSSDSLTLISSWLAGKLYSQNSNTQLTINVFTGSASGSISSLATAVAGARGAVIDGARHMPLAVGVSSLIGAGQYFAVYGNHRVSAGLDALIHSVGVQANTLFGMGQATSGAPEIWAPLNGAFSSTSMTDVANSNQWLMPPSVATSAITVTASGQILRPPIMFRGI